MWATVIEEVSRAQGNGAKNRVATDQHKYSKVLVPPNATDGLRVSQLLQFNNIEMP
jgi:hypothetical protein